MAQQGLFTAGTSIEELLAKRNTRANALQQSLMANAAQGAARPMEAQAYSLLGSSLGRALAGSMDGGQDKQMDALKSEEANRQRLVGQTIEARRGSSAAMFAHAKLLNDDPSKRYTQAALDMTDKAIAKKKEEDLKAKQDLKDAQDDLVIRAELEADQMEAQAIQDYAFSLGDNFNDNPAFKKLLQSGKASPQIIELANKQIAEKNNTVSLTNDGKLLVESGMVAGTPEFKAAITDILAKKGTLRNIQTPMEQRQMLTGFIQSDKQYLKAKEKLLMVGDAFNLLPSVRVGGQKETALLERTVSEVYNSQTKAVSEIDRLVSKGSWGRGMQDWINNGFRGTPSAASVDEYENVLTIMDTAMRSVVNGVVDTQAGIYGDLMTGDNLAKSTENLRVSSQREATVTDTDLGTPLGTAGDRPDGVFNQGGKSFKIVQGIVYAN